MLTAGEPDSIYELLRGDIIEGRLAANERFEGSALAERYGTSTNPIREALQHCGRRFVVIETTAAPECAPSTSLLARHV